MKPSLITPNVEIPMKLAGYVPTHYFPDNMLEKV